MDKKSARIRRAARARHMMREQGVTRLVIHRTPRHIYAQVIAVVGKLVAERALAKGVKDVAFDRSGFKYHGRVQTLADAAREAGLQF